MPGILCGLCKKHRATKICKRCAPQSLQCDYCCLQHERLVGHTPKSVCVECFAAPSQFDCTACGGKICKNCFVQHAQVCDAADESSDESDASDEAASEHSFESEDLPLRPSAPLHSIDNKASLGKSTKAPSTKPPAASKRPQPTKPKPVKKYARVVEPTDPVASSAAAKAAGEAVLNRIRKALQLGLHEGGSENEKRHAMQRATRLMQQYGLSQADVESEEDDITKLSGQVEVKLTHLQKACPVWGSALMSVATDMCGVKCFYTKGCSKEKPYSVTFYGLKADAHMAAQTYEVAFNTVMHMGDKFIDEQNYAGQHKQKSKLDYRNGMARGLSRFAREDKEARDKHCAELREKQLALAAQEDGSGMGTATLPAVKTEPEEYGQKPARPACDGAGPAGGHDGPRTLPRKGSQADESWGNLGPDDGGESDGGGWGSDGAGSQGRSSYGSGSNAQPSYGNLSATAAARQGIGSAVKQEVEPIKVEDSKLILYHDKSKLAIEKMAASLNLSKGRKRKYRKVVDVKAYNQGRADAKSVNIGAKRIKPV